MAAAGASATDEARRQMARAEAHEHEAALARDAAARFGLAGITEKRVATELTPLSALGYHLLPDRAWPGSRSAQVDLIIVGPSVIHADDTKAWHDLSIHEGGISLRSREILDRLERTCSARRSGSASATLTFNWEGAVRHRRRRLWPRGAFTSFDPHDIFRLHASRLRSNEPESFGWVCMGAGMPESWVFADDVAGHIGASKDSSGRPFHNVGRLRMFWPGAVDRRVRGNAAADEDA